MDLKWTDVVVAIGSIVTPLTVVVVGLLISRAQSRNEQLQALRIEFYRQLAPRLNAIMTYVTMIGDWRDVSPPEVIRAKRELDVKFHVAAPLFSDKVGAAYSEFIGGCFATFGDWGTDARIRSSPFQRRRVWRRRGQKWDRGWDALFTLAGTDEVRAEDQLAHRQRYDRLLNAIVAELQVTKARLTYTTDRVALNAFDPSQGMTQRSRQGSSI